MHWICKAADKYNCVNVCECIIENSAQDKPCKCLYGRLSDGTKRKAKWVAKDENKELEK